MFCKKIKQNSSIIYYFIYIRLSYGMQYIHINTGCPPLNPPLQPEYVTNNIHTDNVKGSYSSTIFP